MKHFNYPRNLMFQLFLESWHGQAAKKKDKAGDGAEAEKPKPVAFGCEAGHSIRPSYRTYGTGPCQPCQDCNWYVCVDCHGKKGEKQWQCMLQADSNGFCHVLPCFASWLV